MARARWGPASRRRRKRLFKMAEGFRAGRKRLVRHATPSVRKSLVYARRDRRARRREFRRLWIARLNAACRLYGTTYSRLMHGLRQANISLDRKHLADLAVNDQAAFKQLVDVTMTPATAN